MQGLEERIEEPRAAQLEPKLARELFHRWLVEYNPMYLLSAALVYAGLTLVSREVAALDSVWAHLGVPLIAEIYALALIGGAAILVRLGHRRPAAMLGLLVVLFMGDLTLHVETCSYLGLAGKTASAVWLLMFFAKLYLLGRALELRFSRTAVAVAAIGAIGLALLPHLMRVVEPSTRSAVVTLWLFGLSTAAVWTTRNVESAVGWDVRGRRCVHGAWAIWASLAIAHAVFWGSTYQFDVGLALVGAPLVLARYARRESLVWLSVGLSAFAVLQLAPDRLWLVGLMGAATLLLAATRGRFEHQSSVVGPRPAPPYRSYEPLHTFVVVHDFRPQARPRFAIGTVLAIYVSGWTLGWTGGALPEHHLGLDALLVVACLATSQRWRRPMLLTSLGPVLGHLAVQRGWISEPTTALEWGATSVAAGFVMLFASLGLSWRLSKAKPSRPPPAILAPR